MICKNCGQPVQENARFCGHCGAEISNEVSSHFCTDCGAKLEPSEHYCHSCGKKIDVSFNVSFGETRKMAGTLLDTMKAVSLYIGEPKAGYSIASGTLSIYTDRLEFKKITGSAISARSDLLAGLVDSITKLDPVTVYSLDRIVELRIGKYMAVYNTLVVVLQDEVFSFCPAIPKSSHPRKVIDMLKPYLPANKIRF